MTCNPIVIDRSAFNQGSNALYEPSIEESDVMATLVAKGPHAVYDVAGTMGSRTGSGGGFSTDFEIAGGLVPCDLFQAVAGADLYNCKITGDVAATMSKAGSGVNETGPTVIGFSANMSEPDATLNASPAIKAVCPPSVAHTLRAEADAGEDVTGRGTPLAPTQISVRRLTPRECERLQGFPDDWTLVPHRNKPAADGPRYKAIGNSMAVNVMRWIGRRIQANL